MCGGERSRNVASTKNIIYRLGKIFPSHRKLSRTHWTYKAERNLDTSTDRESPTVQKHCNRAWLSCNPLLLTTKLGYQKNQDITSHHTNFFVLAHLALPYFSTLDAVYACFSTTNYVSVYCMQHKHSLSGLSKQEPNHRLARTAYSRHISSR